MKYPICIQTEQKKNDYILKYFEEDDKFKYHLGIHYSTSSYIYYYLMRQEPYSDLLIKLQNYHQENPNRMFIGIYESISILENGKDPRELIPEFFTRFEYLINLNCDFFGIRSNDRIVDDNLINFFNSKKEKNPFYKYINFIIEHRKLLNSNIISINLNDWLDNIYGVDQLPKKNIRDNSCNIYMKMSYEQEMNLKKNLEKYLEKLKKKEKNPKEILKKITSKINSVLSFGQTPHQIFKEKHCKRQLNQLNIVENNDKINEKENDEEDDKSDNEDFEKISLNIANQKESYISSYIIKDKFNYIYFDINSIINKIFILSLERNVEIINTELESNIKEVHDNIQLKIKKRVKIRILIKKMKICTINL